jgi:GT2 family glycosyltransferase
VVVCTHERPEDLDDCLRALAACNPCLEVVVVDSGPSVPCRELVIRHRDRLPGVRYVHVPEPGLSRARNAGVAAATGELVAFIDDDAAVQPGWDRAIVAAFAGDSDIGCVGGACRPRFAAERPPWLSDRLLSLSSITRFGDGSREPRSSAEWPFGANMAFRRRALAEIGPFAEELGRRGSLLLSGEDSDMVARALRAGWRVWLEPAAVVLHTVHAERLQSRFYWRRLWWAGVGRAQQAAARTTLRLLVAVPVRMLLWALTGDRIYMYRLAESAGYMAGCAKLGAGASGA